MVRVTNQVRSGRPCQRPEGTGSKQQVTVAGAGTGQPHTRRQPDRGSMRVWFAPRQISAEMKRRVKADRLTPASPTGFRPSIYVTSTAGSGTSGCKLRLQQAKLCPHPAHQHIRDCCSHPRAAIRLLNQALRDPRSADGGDPYSDPDFRVTIYSAPERRCRPLA